MPILFFRTHHVDARALIAKMRQVNFGPEQLINFRTATMKYLSIGLRVLLTLAFVGAGLAKLAGAEMMIATYDAIGIGQWFRYVTGIIEVGGAILLWFPRRQVLAAALLGGTMVGAILAHVFILGVAEGIPAIVLGLICSALIYLHRDQINETLGR
jgi:putative oxidoreductase